MKIFGMEIKRAAETEKVAKTKSIFSTVASFFSAMGGTSDPKADEQLAAYGKNEWVYAAIDARAKAISQSKLRLKIRKPDGTSEEYTKEHEAMQLLKKPNDDMTRGDLFKLLSMHKDTTGRAFWKVFKTKGAKGKKQIVPLNPAKVEVLSGDGENVLIEGYKLTNHKGEKVPLVKSEVIFFRSTDPVKMFDGLSPLKPCAATFDSDFFASRWNLNFFKNNGKVGSTLKVPGKLTDKQRERIEKQWKQKYQGVDNAHKLAILEAGAEIDDNGASHKDMEFTGLGQNAKDRILAVYRTSPAILGQSSDFNKANIYGIEYIFARWTIHPELKEIAEYLNAFYLPLFDNTENLFFEFDNPSPEDKEFLLEEQKADFATGSVTPNEIRKRKGRKEVDGGDQAFVPASVLPVDFQDTPAEETPAVESKGVKKKAKVSEKILLQAWLRRFAGYEKSLTLQMTRLFRIQEKEVLEKLKQQTKDLTEDIFDLDKWEGEFITVSVPIFRKIFEVEGQSAIDELGLDVSFKKDDPKLRRIIAEQSVKFAKDVNKTTIERIRKVLQEGVAEGEGEAELGKRVKEVFTTAKTARTKTIARTETLKAANTGHLEAYQQVGVKKKRWLSAEDSRVRPTHARANGQTVGINKQFTVGSSKLDHPGDLSAPAKETINCRCRMVPVLE